MLSVLHILFAALCGPLPYSAPSESSPTAISERLQAMVSSPLNLLRPDMLVAVCTDVNGDGATNDMDLDDWYGSAVPIAERSDLPQVMAPEGDYPGECTDVPLMRGLSGGLVVGFEYDPSLDLNLDGEVNIVDSHLIRVAIGDPRTPVYFDGRTLWCVGALDEPAAETPGDYESNTLGGTLYPTTNIIHVIKPPFPPPQHVWPPPEPGPDFEKDPCERHTNSDPWPSPMDPVDRLWDEVRTIPCCIAPPHMEFVSALYHGRLSITEGYYMQDSMDLGCNVQDGACASKQLTIKRTDGSKFRATIGANIESVLELGVRYEQSGEHSVSDTGTASCCPAYNCSRTCRVRFLKYTVAGSLTIDYDPNLCWDWWGQSTTETFYTTSLQEIASTTCPCSCDPLTLHDN